jgi:hypothetical protein
LLSFTYNVLCWLSLLVLSKVDCKILVLFELIWNFQNFWLGDGKSLKKITITITHIIVHLSSSNQKASLPYKPHNQIRIEIFPPVKHLTYYSKGTVVKRLLAEIKTSLLLIRFCAKIIYNNYLRTFLQTCKHWMVY